MGQKVNPIGLQRSASTAPGIQPLVRRRRTMPTCSHEDIRKCATTWRSG